VQQCRQHNFVAATLISLTAGPAAGPAVRLIKIAHRQPHMKGGRLPDSGKSLSKAFAVTALLDFTSLLKGVPHVGCLGSNTIGQQRAVPGQTQAAVPAQTRKPSGYNPIISHTSCLTPLSFHDTVYTISHSHAMLSTRMHARSLALYCWPYKHHSSQC